MHAASRAAVGAVSSLVLHGAAALALAAMLTTREMPDQAVPKSRIEMTTATLARKDAIARDTAGDAAADVAPEDRAAVGGTIVRRDARPATAPSRRAEEADAGAKLDQSDARRRQASGLRPDSPEVMAPPVSGQRVGATAIGETVIASASNPAVASVPVPVPSVPLTGSDAPIPVAVRVVARTKVAAAKPPERRRASPAGIALISRPLQPDRPQQVVLATATPSASTVVATAPGSSTVEPQAAQIQPAPRLDAVGPLSGAVVAEAPDAAAAQPDEIAALPAALDQAQVTAKLAWSGGEQLALDPAAMLALTTFVAPESAGAEGQQLRDGIGNLLTSVPCARLQTAFDSTTGQLELRGHVPQDDMRAKLAAAIQAQIGDGLPVVDKLTLLPEPQCGILGQLDALGVPQSEEQFTDPGHIGETLFVREYAFTAGDRMVIDLEAADYPGFVYVDYFDADGNVLHLTPNEALPLRFHAAGEAFSIGSAGSGLDLIVEPPFGQDIAVALASDRQLYDGLRPLVEPAGAYLAFLRQRIEEVRPERAEWVYLMLKTSR